MVSRKLSLTLHKYWCRAALSESWNKIIHHHQLSCLLKIILLTCDSKVAFSSMCIYKICIDRSMSKDWNIMEMFKVEGKRLIFDFFLHIFRDLLSFLSSSSLHPAVLLKQLDILTDIFVHLTGCSIRLQNNKYRLQVPSHLSRYLTIHWSSMKRRKMIHVSSSVSSCDFSHVPFCSFYFSSWGFSPSFSFYAFLHQKMSGICCPFSSSSLWSPCHSMMKQIWGVSKQAY